MHAYVCLCACERGSWSKRNERVETSLNVYVWHVHRVFITLWERIWIFFTLSSSKYHLHYLKDDLHAKYQSRYIHYLVANVNRLCATCILNSESLLYLFVIKPETFSSEPVLLLLQKNRYVFSSTLLEYLFIPFIINRCESDTHIITTTVV